MTMGVNIFRLVGDEVHEHQAILELECFAQRAFHIGWLVDVHADVVDPLGTCHIQ